MNLYEQLHPMETNMSKGVGEHFIYLCIPKFLPAAFMDGSFEAAAGASVYGPSQVITKVRLHTHN